MGYKLVGLCVAGACGTLARYGLASLLQRGRHAGFPWGTLAVNVLGCFLFGLIWTSTQQRFVINSDTRTIILVGFLGAFTTFSSFQFETAQMLEHAEWLMAGLNLGGSLALGFGAYLLGAWVARIV